MQLVVFEVEPHQHAYFDNLSGFTQVRLTQAPLHLENVQAYAEAAVISTMNLSDLRPEVLASLPQLRHIASRTTGIDHLPLDYCLKHGITWSSVPVYGQHTVAEHTFALLLALSHQLLVELPRPAALDFIPRGPAGFDLVGKTLGVIGTGNIGRHVVRIGQGFGMSVLAHDIAPDIALAQRLGFRYVSKQTVLTESDIVTLHVPADASTHHLIDAAALAKMQPGTVLVNTARGSVVDVVALAAALESGHLRGACLDVLPYEDILRNQKRLQGVLAASAITPELAAVRAVLQLVVHPRVVMTSHMAYNTQEALHRILSATRQNLLGLLPF
jgi:D-lactate dehydrogenase